MLFLLVACELAERQDAPDHANFVGHEKLEAVHAALQDAERMLLQALICCPILGTASRTDNTCMDWVRAGIIVARNSRHRPL